MTARRVVGREFDDAAALAALGRPRPRPALPAHARRGTRVRASLAERRAARRPRPAGTDSRVGVQVGQDVLEDLVVVFVHRAVDQVHRAPDDAPEAHPKAHDGRARLPSLAIASTSRFEWSSSTTLWLRGGALEGRQAVAGLGGGLVVLRLPGASSIWRSQQVAQLAHVALEEPGPGLDELLRSPPRRSWPTHGPEHLPMS